MLQHLSPLAERQVHQQHTVAIEDVERDEGRRVLAEDLGCQRLSSHSLLDVSERKNLPLLKRDDLAVQKKIARQRSDRLNDVWKAFVRTVHRARVDRDAIAGFV